MRSRGLKPSGFWNPGMFLSPSFQEEPGASVCHVGGGWTTLTTLTNLGVEEAFRRPWAGFCLHFTLVKYTLGQKISLVLRGDGFDPVVFLGSACPVLT